MGSADARSSTIATMLLAVAPALVVNGARRPSEIELVDGIELDRSGSLAQVTGHIVDVLTRCVCGDSAALLQGERLIATAAAIRGAPILQTMAAADYLDRAIFTNADEQLGKFVLSDHSERFATPKVVAAVMERFTVPPDSALHDANVLACRHLMASTVVELDALRLALPGASFFEMMGKPYSVNQLAIAALRNRSIDVASDSCETPQLSIQQLGSFAYRHGRIAKGIVERFVRRHGKSSRPLLVIDDGGALIHAVGSKVADGGIRSPVVAIEQTTHGLFAVDHLLQDHNVRAHGFTLISVADSVSKLKDESPLIAQSVVESIEMWLEWLRTADLVEAPPLSSLRIGIIGFGSVGSHIAMRLSRDSRVSVYDRNRPKLMLAESIGCTVTWSLPHLLSDSDLVIAASGEMSIGAEETAYLRDETILVSASSGDVEFGGLATWSTEVLPVMATGEATSFDLSHGLIVARHNDGRTVYVLNRGFPVNFDGSCDPIALEDIQLTRALIVGAVLQGARSFTSESSSPIPTGRSGLNEEIDRFIAEEFRRLQPQT